MGGSWGMVKGDVPDGCRAVREASEMRAKAVNVEEERGRSAFLGSRFSSFELTI